MHDRSILGPTTTSIEHTEYRRIAQQAVTRALTIHAGDNDPAPIAVRSLDRQPERTVEL